MKRLFVNKTDDDRTVACDAKINKPAVRKLYWFCEPVGGNNTPLNFLRLSHRGGFGPSGASQIALYTDKDGVCKHDDFQLSVCGKDQFKVSVGLKPDGSDKIEDETYESWRRVYFSVRYMDPKFVFDFGPVLSEYRKHGIDPKQIAPAGGAPRIRYREIIEKPEQAYALVQDVTEHGLEGRAVLVDRIWLSETREIRVRTKNLTVSIQGNDLALEPGNIVWPRDGFASGEVSGKGIANFDVTPYLRRAGNFEVRIDIPSGSNLGKVLTEAAGRAKLTYRLKIKQCGILTGFAQKSSGRIIIANRGLADSPREVQPRQNTLIHEMGHGLGMVPAGFQEYNEFTGNPYPMGPTKNDMQYERSGGHCSTGATGSAPNYVKGKCAMYHAGYDEIPLDFCGTCAPIVKRLNLNRSEMKWP